jgi:small subunit ribosomal protein S6
LRDYETVIIWNASIPENEIDREHDKIVDIIKGEGGAYSSSDKWSRRILAYPIKKQTEGIYHFLKWNGESGVIEAIDKYLRINDSCLRFLTLQDEEGEGTASVDSDFEDEEEEYGEEEDDDEDEMESEDQ